MHRDYCKIWKSIAINMFFWSLQSYIFNKFSAFLPLWTEELYQAFSNFFNLNLLSVIPPLIYFPCSALIFKSSCSRALICLVLAESPSNTSWPLADLPQCCCVTLPQDFIFTCSCCLPAFCSIVLCIFTFYCGGVCDRDGGVSRNQRSTCLRYVRLFHVTFWRTFRIHSQTD